ncbi:uncharacterized protein LOC125234764 [Leguminivora glycinivorella]|uniref:uncharacterized protein LOC125234764 n=1 Tax=Leguminivora glycinivorella TaxID=1035111 RepID=UPI00200DC2A8|nr:uncharacterized protein LOC125234764 [Leguminivora glycinivorella]
MKLFILAALIAVSSAARLEHLEQQRGLKELASAHSGHHQFDQQSVDGDESNNFSSQVSDSVDAEDSAAQGLKAGFAGVRVTSQRSNGIDAENSALTQRLRAGAAGARSLASLRANEFETEDSDEGSTLQGLKTGEAGARGFTQQSNVLKAGDSAGFGSTRRGLKAGAGGAPARSNEYLPPGHGPSGSNAHGQDALEASSNQFASQSQFSQNKFRTQGSGIFRPQGSTDGNDFGSQGSTAQGSRFGSRSSNSYGAQRGSRGQNEYLPPRTSHDNIPQQAFDPETGYIY